MCNRRMDMNFKFCQKQPMEFAASSNQTIMVKNI